MLIPNDDSARNGRAYPISEFKHRDAWLRLLLADTDLPFPTKAVGTCIALHLNVKTGRCDPPLPMLASGTGMSVRNVRRMLRALEDGGWLLADQSTGGRRSGDTYNSSSLELRVPLTRTHLSALNPDTSVRDKGLNPDKSGRLTRTSRVANPDTVVRQDTSDRTSEETIEEKKDSRLDLVVEDSGRRQSNDETSSFSFDLFWQAYPKRVAKTAALKSYHAVITKGLATKEELLEGAKRYAAERHGKDQQFTRHPATWLNSGCWADETAPEIQRSDPIDIGMVISRQIAERNAGHD